ncbi:MAG: ATP-binding cassette domain-containing protein [Planctomycetota bacterium]|nr:ATP-binding cassette domain-containing protein [Planctomycetota bacterium]
MSIPPIELINVTKTYGEFKAVDDISFTVPEGTICGFLGPNGAGKTTSIRMMLDILRPSSGSISILGAPRALDVRRRIGYLPEEKGLYKKMTATAMIAYFATLKGVPAREAKTTAGQLLEKYGLGSFQNHKCEALSKGMGQKVQVLASIAHDPDLVILDEPFSGLDPVNQGVMEEVIRDIRTRGKTILFSTHVMSHAERICERVVIMAAGRLIFDGTVEEAQSLLPRRVRVRGEGAASTLEQMHEVLSSSPSTDGREGVVELRLREGADPQKLLKNAFEKKIALEIFEVVDPNLHEVFVHLVGEDAREAAFR